MQWPETVVGPKAAPPILLEAQLELAPGHQEDIYRDACRIMRARKAKQPTWQPSAGCFFKNPSSQTPAGRLIDQAGLKGTRVGDAQVARRHANFIVNRGNATASEVMALARKVQGKVRQQFGINLETEVCIVGEETNAPKPL